jgi:hypothetical protein
MKLSILKKKNDSINKTMVQHEKLIKLLQIKENILIRQVLNKFRTFHLQTNSMKDKLYELIKYKEVKQKFISFNQWKSAF